MNPKTTKEQRKQILNYGTEHGISSACRKYSISRTIYYRWKKRFDESGLEGLKDRVRHFVPVNRLSSEIEEILFSKVTEHPDYGPLSLKWLLEEDEIYISSSGVYNILKRNNLSRRNDREKYSKNHKKKRPLPRDFKPSYGQLWICWTDERKNLIQGQLIYQYSITDVASGISCSRLYTEKSSDYALDLLLGLAVPIGKELHMNPEIIITQDDRIYKTNNPRTENPYSAVLKAMGIRQFKWDIDFKDYQDLSNKFSRQSMEYLRKISNFETMGEVKSALQNFLREFNMDQNLTFGPGKGLSPLDNVREFTHKEINLPIWAYLDRQY